MAEDLLRAGGAGRPPADGPLDPVELAVEGEVELDGQRVRLLVDQLGGLEPAAAVVAEQGVGDRVEDARLAAPVGAREHPQLRPVEPDLLLLLVREEPGELDTLGDHRHLTASRVRASRVSDHAGSHRHPRHH